MKLIKKNAIWKAFLQSLIIWIMFSILIIATNKIIFITTKNRILDSIQIKIEDVSYLIDKEITKNFNILRLLAHNLTSENLASPGEMAKTYDEIVEKNNFKMMGITLPDGTAYLHTGEVIDLSDREYFQESMNGSSSISTVLKSKIGLRNENVYSVPIIDQGQIIGVLWASVLTEVFYEDLKLDSLSGYGEVFLIDEEGALITQKDTLHINSNFFDLVEDYYNESKANKPHSDQMQSDIEKDKEGYRQFIVNGEEVYIYYSKLNYDDWWILTKVSEQKIKEMNRDISIVVFGISTFLFFLASIGVILFYFSIKKSHTELKKVAYLDPITNGKNDIFLKNNLKKILNKKDKFAFISLEAANIKSLVSILGYSNSQYLLKGLYDFIEGRLNEGECIVHSYFGEYKLIVKYHTVNELKKRLEEFMDYRKQISVEFKGGIFLIEDLNIGFEEMCAYVNMAKENLTKNNTYGFYNKEVRKNAINRVKLEEDIKNGILNDEFKAWFQPKCGPDGKTIVGAEALVRWYKYDSVIAPYIFIPVCEASGLMEKIDTLLLEDVCRKLRIWMNHQKKVVPISVNLSRSYLNSTDCVDRLQKIISKYSIPNYLIEFEITESSLSENEDKLKEIIDKFHENGFQVLLDDFGMGYSSISAISRMNFDVMKIDKSFIDGIGTQAGEDILKYTIQLARSFEMDIVAEGVETTEQYEFLCQHDFDQLQGYYYSKPLSAKDFSKFMEDHLDNQIR